MRDTTRVIDTIHVRDTTHVIDTICAIDTTHLRSAAPVNARVIRENNFDSLVTSIGSIALVKFYQPGSAVCRSLMWVIDTLATTFKDSACIGAVNVDSNAALCQRFNVTTVPSYLFLKNGAVVSRRSFLTDDSTAFDTVSAVLRGLIAETRIPPGVVVLDTSNLQHMIGVYGRISMVHFFSPMCGACQVMAPVVDNLATRYGGTALIGKTDIIKYPVFLSGLMYNIRSYPTSIFFDGGTEYARIVGVVSVDSLASVVDRGLAR